jgi:hypothetical protein
MNGQPNEPRPLIIIVSGSFIMLVLFHFNGFEGNPVSVYTQTKPKATAAMEMPISPEKAIRPGLPASTCPQRKCP